MADSEKAWVDNSIFYSFSIPLSSFACVGLAYEDLDWLPPLPTSRIASSHLRWSVVLSMNGSTYLHFWRSGHCCLGWYLLPSCSFLKFQWLIVVFHPRTAFPAVWGFWCSIRSPLCHFNGMQVKVWTRRRFGIFVVRLILTSIWDSPLVDVLLYSESESVRE